MKMGRPKLKRGLVKSVQVGIRYSTTEFKTILDALKLQGLGKNKIVNWIRSVTLDAAIANDKLTFRLVRSKIKPPINFVGFGTERFTYMVRCPECAGTHIKDVPRPEGIKSYRCQTCGLLWSFARGEGAKVRATPQQAAEGFQKMREAAK